MPFVLLYRLNINHKCNLVWLRETVLQRVLLKFWLKKLKKNYNIK